MRPIRSTSTIEKQKKRKGGREQKAIMLFSASNGAAFNGGERAQSILSGEAGCTNTPPAKRRRLPLLFVKNVLSNH